MNGKHEESSKKTRNRFANAVVTVCMAVALFVTCAEVYEYHRLNEPMPASVVTAIMGMWTGELLIMALRQICGSDAAKRGVRQDTDKTTDDSNIFGGSI